MLLEFKLANFGCFPEEQTFSLGASSDKTLPSHLICRDGQPSALKGALIYGPNGGGKSTVVRALARFREIVLNSTRVSVDRPLMVEPFKLDKARSQAPSTLAATFVHGGIRHEYGFSADRSQIHEEWLFAWPNGRLQKWFERRGNRFTFGSGLKGEKNYLARFTRENCLFLSMASFHNHEQLRGVFSWFSEKLMVAESRWLEGAEILESAGARIFGQLVHVNRVAKDAALKKRLAQLLAGADLGISGIDLEQRDWAPGELSPIEGMSQEEAMESLKGLGIDGPTQVFTRHRTSDGVDIRLSLSEESLGSQQLFHLAPLLFDAQDKEATLVVDEIFPHLHPVLTERILTDFFRSAGGGQLITTTHDMSLLNQDLVRRDQVWMVEKSAQGEARLFSLADFSPRKDTVISKGYQMGRYGGVPIVGDLGLRHSHA